MNIGRGKLQLSNNLVPMLFKLPWGVATVGPGAGSWFQNIVCGVFVGFRLLSDFIVYLCKSLIPRLLTTMLSNQNNQIKQNDRIRAKMD